MKLIRIYLVLILSAGAEALALTLQGPSEARSAVWLGLSPARLVLLALLAGLWLLCLAGSIWLWRSPERMGRILQAADEWFLTKKQLAPGVLALGILLTLAFCAAAAVLSTPLDYEVYGVIAPYTFPTLYSWVSRLLPLLLWLFLAGLFLLLAVLARYRAALLRPAVWAPRHWLSPLILLAAALAALAHWIILAFQLRFFANHPAWYWEIHPRPFTLRDVFLAALVTALLILAWRLLAHSRPLPGLLALFLAGLVLQLGIGYLEGGGMAALRDRYLTRYHSSYLRRASENQLSILENLRRYEELHGDSMFARTKPPGLLAFYIAVDQLINGYPSRYAPQERLERSAWLVTYTFPILAAGMVFLLYAFARRWIDPGSDGTARLAPALFILAPNIALFSLYPDQAIYPGLFLLGVWWVTGTVRRQAVGPAFLLGAGLYLAAFFAFTMLPLFTFAAVFLVIETWRCRRERGPLPALWVGLAFLAGVICAYLVFRILLNYDFFTRFSITTTINHAFDFYTRVGLPLPSTPEPLPARAAQVLQAAWINNLDFASTTGFAVYILFIAQAARVAVGFARRAAGPAEAVLLALVLNFLLLNAAGTAQGEVGRLWMFWVPVVALFAARELLPWQARDRRVLLVLMAVQLITVLLTYHFQDLRM